MEHKAFKLLQHTDGFIVSSKGQQHTQIILQAEYWEPLIFRYFVYFNHL